MENSVFPAVNDTPQAELSVPNPDQPQAEPGQEGQEVAQNQEQTQAQQEQQWFLEAETGTRYSTPEAAAAGIAEKDRYIAKLTEMLTQREAPQAAAPAVDPAAAEAQVLAEYAREIEGDYHRNPKYSGYSAEAIREQAEIDARNQYKAEQRALSKFQAQRQAEAQQQAEIQARTRDTQIVQQHPYLRSPQGEAVFQKYQSMGLEPRSAEEHLMYYEREYGPVQGAPKPVTPQANYQGVNGAVGYAQNQGRIFQAGAQGTTQPPVQAIPPQLQQEMEWAKSKGYSEEQVKLVASKFMGANQ